MKEGDILMEQSHKGRQAFSYAFPIMIPMGISFFFIGLGFGLYATSQGFPWWHHLFWQQPFLQDPWSL